MDMAVWAFIVLVVAFILVATNYVRQLQRKIRDLQRELTVVGKQIASKQRSVIKGQIAEQMYPMSADCPYLPSDMRFIGHPIDYLIIDGYTECKDDGGEVREVILADIKTGNARLSAHQRAIKAAVEQGRVRFVTIHQ